MPTRPGRDVLMEVLEAEGVQYIFGNPGTTEGAIMHALEDRPDLEYILVAQEGVAVGMADGYARESGRPGFVNLHIETGLSNGLSLMCNAYAGGTPMVVTAANSSIGKVAEGRTDLVDLARPFSKWGAEVTNAGQLPAVMRRAFREAKTPPTGPTFVSLAQNALDEMTDVRVAPSGDLSTVLTPDPQELQAAARLLASAERPALLVGDRVAQYGAVDQMVRVAELLGTPVYGASYPTMMFPTSHPQWMHQLPPYVGLYREAFAETDVLLAVGARVFHDFFAPATGILADDARLVHLDINQDAIGRVEPTDVGIWSDLGIGLDELYAAVSELQTPAQADAARLRAESLAAGYPGRRADPPAIDGTRPMPSTAMMAGLAEGLPADVIVVDDSISCRPDLHGAVTFDHRRRVQAERAGGAIGWGMGGPWVSHWPHRTSASSPSSATAAPCSPYRRSGPPPPTRSRSSTASATTPATACSSSTCAAGSGKCSTNPTDPASTSAWTSTNPSTSPPSPNLWVSPPNASKTQPASPPP